MKFVLPKKIRDMINWGKDRALTYCRIHGHDPREVSRVEDELCICCGENWDNEKADPVADIKQAIEREKNIIGYRLPNPALEVQIKRLLKIIDKDK